MAKKDKGNQPERLNRKSRKKYSRNLSDFGVLLKSLASMLNSGRFQNRGQYRDMSVVPSYSTIITKNNIKGVLAVDSVYPYFKGSIADIASTAAVRKGAMANTVISSTPVAFQNEVRSTRYRNQYKKAVERYSQFKSLFDSKAQEGESLDMGFTIGSGRKKITYTLDQLLTVKSVRDSYLYVNEIIKTGGQLVSSYITIEIMGATREIVDEALIEVQIALDSHGVNSRQIVGNLNEYMSSLSVTSFLKKNKDMGLSPLLFSEDNTASILPTGRSGISCDGKGVLLGLGYKDHFPFFYNLTESGQAQNTLICGRSGWGKTYMAYQIAIGCLALNHHVNVLDIKGDEWNKIATVCDNFPYIEISMGESSGAFVNMLRMDDMKLDNESCLELYSNTLQGLIRLLAIVSGYDKKEYIKEYPVFEYIISGALEGLFFSAGVRKNIPETFVYSKDLNYSDILSALSKYLDSSSMREIPEDRKLGLEVMRRISPFCKGSGMYSGLFKREVTLGEIIESPLVIWSMGRNKNENLSVIDAIRTVMVMSISKKKQTVRKMEGKFTDEFYEEMQRTDDVQPLMPYIVYAVSGGRSMNISTFLLCNSLSMFMDTDNEQLLTVASNLTSFIFGKLQPKDIKIATEELGCGILEDYLKEIGEMNLQAFGQVEAKPFAALIDSGKSKKHNMITTMLPKRMSSGLHTRDMA